MREVAVDLLSRARDVPGVEPPELDLVPTRANGQPAFGVYLLTPESISQEACLYVLTLAADRISAMTRFENTVFPSFGLPRSLASLVDA